MHHCSRRIPSGIRVFLNVEAACDLVKMINWILLEWTSECWTSWCLWNSIKMWSGCTSLLLITPCHGRTDGASNDARMDFIVCNKTLLAGPFHVQRIYFGYMALSKRGHSIYIESSDPNTYEPLLFISFAHLDLFLFVCANCFIHCSQSFFISFCRSMLCYRPCLYTSITMSV